MNPIERELALLIGSRCDSVEQLQAMLVAVDDWGRRRRDLRGVFAAAYAVVTAEILAALARELFSCPEWVQAVVVDFGERYRLALEGRLGGEAASQMPVCWVLALARTRGDGLAAISVLLLGMVAHIHHDLALSLHSCGPLDHARSRDYSRIGEVLRRATPSIQREVIAGYAPELARIHHALRGVDTRITSELVLGWRSRAQTVAQRMAGQPQRASQWSRRLQRESAALALVVLPASLMVGALLERVRTGD